MRPKTGSRNLGILAKEYQPLSVLSSTERGIVIPKDRPDLTTHAWRTLRSQVLAESTVCIVCGHPGSRTVDHVVPVSRGGAEFDPDNAAPIHGVERCPVCDRNCNNDKGNRLLSEMQLFTTSVDWWSGLTA